jgi:3-mercaptopyruvate sulfurtransferase SseA
MRPQTQKAGHLPGAIRIDWEELLDEGNRSRLKGAKALEKVFADQEVVRDKDLVAY